VTVRPALFSADALLLITIAARRLPRNDLSGEVSLLCGELALPLSGGSRQPLDRQVSYYSELMRLASELQAPQTQETPLQRVALHCSALVTGLPANSWAAVVSAAPTSDFPGRSASFEGRFVGGCSCRVSAFLGLVRTLPAPIHHWRLFNSNHSAIPVFL
jgi:hypothetical protein